MVSETAAEGELQVFGLVGGFLADRFGETDDDRTDRRTPLQRDADRCAHGVEAEIAGLRIHVAEVDEGRNPGRLGGQQAREEGLDGAGRLDRAAQWLVERRS